MTKRCDSNFLFPLQQDILLHAKSQFNSVTLASSGHTVLEAYVLLKQISINSIVCTYG